MGFTPNREELAWAAGFFDGEGSFGVYRAKPRTYRGETKSNTYLRMSVAQAGSDQPPELLLRFRNAVANLGQIRPRRITHLGKKPMWIWQAERVNDIQAVVAMLWPWLGARNRERMKTGIKQYREALFKWQDRTHCHRGHAYDDENTRWIIHDRDGKELRTRQCRACAREQQVRHRQRQRALTGGM